MAHQINIWDTFERRYKEILSGYREWSELSHTPVPANGDTHKQLPARSRYLLFKSADKCTESQKQRAEVIFETYPDLKEAYSLTHSLRMIFSKNTIIRRGKAVTGTPI